jgi:uncharacterized iron-regulated membrane protein
VRKRLWQLHSWLGLVAGLGLLVIGLTGSLLVFREELETLFNRELVRVETSASGRLNLDTLLARAQRQLPDHEVTGWVPSYDTPERADLIYVIRHGTDVWEIATLDPYTGQLLASPRLGTTTLTGWLLDLHYAFFTDHAGMIVVGLLGAMLCALGVTGVWIYREFWKNVLTLRWGRGARLLFSDFHKFVGISSVLFNLLLGFTGAYWNLTHVIGEELADIPEPPKMERRLYADTLSLDSLVADAARRLPSFRANYISLPWMPDAGVTLWGAIEPRGPLTGPYGSQVFYDEKTGAHKSTTDLREAGLWTRIVDTFVPLHYGTFGGLPVKILWCLGGLTPGTLAITGFVIWRVRRRSTLSASRARAISAEPSFSS